jgi:formylglycine-generating enzyme required for sulfatase activity
MKTAALAISLSLIPGFAAAASGSMGSGDDSAVSRAPLSSAPAAGFACRPPKNPLRIQWITIEGGKFMMGRLWKSAQKPLSQVGAENWGLPAHPVAVRSFQMAKAPATYGEYMKCVREGACTKPGCTLPGEDYPVTCVNWFQARDFACWAGGRLPTEAEWEYAARGQGQDQAYPWGDESPEKVFARVVPFPGGQFRTTEEKLLRDEIAKGMIRKVCKTPKADTAQGLCDMTGNQGQWVEDVFHDSYEGAPKDGEAWNSPADRENTGVVRGSYYYNSGTDLLLVASRRPIRKSWGSTDTGIRVARALP